jgi:hypothetical protein
MHPSKDDRERPETGLSPNHAMQRARDAIGRRGPRQVAARRMPPFCRGSLVFHPYRAIDTCAANEPLPPLLTEEKAGVARRAAAHGRRKDQWDERLAADDAPCRRNRMNWLPRLPFAIFFGWLLVACIQRRKSCPDCGQSLPMLRSPLTKTARQWIEGGNVCGHCGCETDSSGAKIAAGAPPRTRSMVIGASLLALAVLPAMALIRSLLISR